MSLLNKEISLTGQRHLAGRLMGGNCSLYGRSTNLFRIATEKPFRPGKRPNSVHLSRRGSAFFFALAKRTPDESPAVPGKQGKDVLFQVCIDRCDGGRASCISGRTDQEVYSRQGSRSARAFRNPTV
jgi:hypothetical protein